MWTLLLACTAAPPPTAVPEPVAAPAVEPRTYATSPKLLERFDTWLEPIDPFRILGNVYYVGSAGLGSYLITSDEGHVLLDGGLPENAPMIASSIEALGLSLGDVKWLLNSHAHLDHSGGLAELKRRTGAVLVASEGDRSALEGGHHLGSEDDPMFAMPPVQVDQVLSDEQPVVLGAVSLVPHVTAGHTRGCTSWWHTTEHEGTSYDVMFFCSATVAGNRLVAPEQYPGIAADYEATFERIGTWKPDVFLANHPEFFDMAAKRRALLSGDPLAFVDAESFGPFASKLEQRFRQTLDKQRSRAASTSPATAPDSR
ncbi:MAG: subclass B3 metallo-beta-lactamase [Myxococcales bacterium]|nr:subclass B3 metallo-beta-lactamase [Myxococcales bacterium]